MNFTESFDQFAKGLSTTDLMIYGGIGLVLWALFKDRLSPVQVFLSNLLNKVVKPVLNTTDVTDNKVKPVNNVVSKNLFFDLVVSWKQTRDLAEKSGCAKAVEVADQMFPYLSPMVCDKEQSSNE